MLKKNFFNGYVLTVYIIPFQLMLINLIFSYLANPHNQVGIYIASDALTPEDYYFEVEILDSGNFATIGEMTLLQSTLYSFL